MSLAISDDLIRNVLTSVRTIAVVGASINEDRPSHNVTKFLVAQGYNVFPVNPGQAGKTIAGRTIAGRLADIGEPIDMVDIFRASASVEPVVDEALALSPRPKVIWMQLGVINNEAAAKAQAAGLIVIMDRCPHIEINRLHLPRR